MKFVKSPNRQDPTHSLPTVQYRNGVCYFEFSKGASGFLEYETDDPKKIAELQDMGYRMSEDCPPSGTGDQMPAKRKYARQMSAEAGA